MGTPAPTPLPWPLLQPSLHAQPCTEHKSTVVRAPMHACRFRSENILNLELDMPERTTYDYVGPGVDPRVQVREGGSDFLVVGREGGMEGGEA